MGKQLGLEMRAALCASKLRKQQVELMRSPNVLPPGLDGLIEEAAELLDDLARERSQAGADKPTYQERLDKTREVYRNAWARWSVEDDLALRSEFAAGLSDVELGERFGRKPNAIRARLNKLRLFRD
jgi:hypothetical protein